MKRLLHFSLGLAFVTTLVAAPLYRVDAATFSQNNIINDVVFDNTMTMTAAQIDTFLNTFPNSCISSNSGFQAIDPTGYNPTQGFLYGGDVTAGHVIYDAAQAYGLNPQVLLSTLQKEEGLVDGSGSYGCSTTAIASAVGYGCPDSQGSYNYSGVDLYTRNGTTYTSIAGTCVDSQYKVGFTQQIIRAAWLLRFGEQRSEGNINWAVLSGGWDNRDDPQSCYSGPMTQGTWQVCPSGASSYYDGYTTIDGTAVHMDNGATAALYWYTPHFSGNQSFFTIFNTWFGSPYVSSIPYSWSLVSENLYADSAHTKVFTDGYTLTPGQKAYAEVIARNFGFEAWSSSVVHLGTTDPTDRASAFADNTWIAPSRVQMQETNVLPGASATFDFEVTAPAQLGSYYEHFNLVADGVTWMNDQGLLMQIDVANQRTPTNTTNTGLTAGQSLAINQYLLSPDTQSILKLQSDGNVVLYSDSSPRWATRTSLSNAKTLLMQSDGNLVLYDANYKPLWASNTNGNSGAYLTLQADGNLVIYSAANAPLWASGTDTFPDYLLHINKTLTNGALYPGQSLINAEGTYRLLMQPDGNLVLYNAQNKPVWASNTDGKQAAYLLAQSDGNLVLYSAAEKPLWAANTDGDGATSLLMQPDGNLVLYNAQNKPVWASNTVGK